MANKRYVTNYSKYVKYKRHQSVDDGVIFEKDYLVLNGDTITRGNGDYGEGNFVITTNKGENLKYDYKSGDYVSPSDEKEYWTYSDTSESSDITDSDIIERSNYGNLRDFVYYGSCVEAVKVSMEGILKGFPAELYVSDVKADTYYGDIPLYITKGGRLVAYTDKETGKGLTMSDFYYVHNEFGIDLHTIVEPDMVPESDYLRYFSASHYDYTFIKDDGKGGESERFWNAKYNVLYPTDEIVSYCDNGKATIIKIVGLVDDDCGDCPILVVYLNGEIITLCRGDNNKNTHIRPQNYFIRKYFNGLDGLKRLILNPDTNPRFSVNITSPVWTERGIVNKKLNLRFPTFNNWNLDVSSKSFDRFYSSLLDTASFMDENYTDNLWKHMVHDSIKNKDNTYVNMESDEDNSDYVIGVGKMEKLMHVIGAFFDRLKYAIDNIKSVNKITYDGNNNTPDYFVSDSNELAGWDIKDPVSVFGYEHTVDNIFSEENHEHSTADAKNRFMRYLNINSPYIFDRKGTKEGLEMVMSLFGLTSRDYAESCGRKGEYDYSVDEFVCVTEGMNGNLDTIRLYNSKKNGFDTTGEDMQGLMVASVFVNDSEYLIPWFDKSVRYDGDVYYQMNGGWGLNTKEGESLDDIYGTNPYGHDESINYIVKVPTLSALLEIPYDSLYEGMVVKIIDEDTVTREEVERLFAEYDNLDGYSFSRYFRLSGYGNTSVFGQEGWYNIPKSDIESNSGYGKLVNHVERIVTTSFGNAPHVGYGLYDDGREYLSYYSKLFKHAIDTGNFSEDMYDCDGQLVWDVGEIGFKGLFDGERVKYVRDNKRVWYFDDGFVGENGEHYTVGDFSDGLYRSDMEPYDFESGKRGVVNESSANSVINTKKIVITFRVLNEENRRFIEECVLPYVKQVIPSTLLLEISYDYGMLAGTMEINEPIVMGVTNDAKSSFAEYLEGCGVDCD